MKMTTKFEKTAEKKMAQVSLDSFWLDDMMDFFSVDYSTEITEEMKKKFHDIFTTPFAAKGNVYTGKKEF
jgi:hypothetical protein